MNNDSILLRNLCLDLVAYFKQLNNPLYEEIISTLEWCIGSFNYDHNPVGLYEKGEKALLILISCLKEFPNENGERIKIALEKILELQV